MVLYPGAALYPSPTLYPDGIDTPPTPLDPPVVLPGTELTVQPLGPDLATAGGPLASVVSVRSIIRWREPGRWEVTLTDPNEAALLSAPGSGVVVRRGDTTVTSGWYETLRVEPIAGGVQYVASGWDHTILLAGVRAWPDPTSPLDAQPDGDRRSGPAETRLLGYVAANMTRLGFPLTVPDSQGRGATATTTERMSTLLDAARTCVAADPMLGFRVIWADRGLTIEVMEGVTRASVLLSEKAGGSLDWQAVTAAPTVTRVIVGAGGEGADRLFRQKADTEAEARWRRPIEDFADKRHLNPDEPTTPTEMDAAASELLMEGGEVSSLTIEATGGPGLTYGIDYRVGDVVTAYPTNGGVVTDQVTQARIDYVWRDGEKVVVTVGQDEKARSDSIEKRLRQVEAV